jgi:hypothetical protein
MIATATVAKNVMSNGNFKTLRKMTASGRLKPTTDIMNASTVPSEAPFSIKALTMGIMPAALE